MAWKIFNMLSAAGNNLIKLFGTIMDLELVGRRCPKLER
jgi:hypothetical protein